VREIAQRENVIVRPRTEVVEGEGGSALERIVILDHETGERERVDARIVFVHIGSDPHTEWLAGCVERDASGFILTGRHTLSAVRPEPAGRPPLSLETSLPGVFAAGDVREGSIKRVSSAVGEGAVAVRFVHEYLTEPVSIPQAAPVGSVHTPQIRLAAPADGPALPAPGASLPKPT
jgi:thioredoxin reductase (NADPH)